MKYIDKLISKLLKNPLPIDEFINTLNSSDRFYNNIDLEKELLINNGLPLYFSKNKVYLKTTITNLANQVFCILDIETTAPTPNQGQLLEIGAIKLKNNTIIETYQALVNCNHIPPKIEEITGIKVDDTLQADSLKTVLEEIKIFIEDDIIVAHNIDFDYNFLSKSFELYDLGKLYNRKICSIKLAQKTIQAEKYGLKYLTEKLNIPIENHHRAYDDALCTTKIFLHCLQNIPSNIKTSEDLIYFSQNSIKI